MQGGPSLCALSITDRSRQVLDYVHGLLSEPRNAPPSLEGLLEDLAHAFDALGAGIATLPDCTPLARFSRDQSSPPRLWPWQIHPELLTEASNGPLAILARNDTDIAFLLAAATQRGGSALLIWLESPGEREWTEGERAALVLTAQTLARLAVEGRLMPSWAGRLDRQARRRRLEDAALVTRRVSHDVGNLLTGVVGFSELALAQIERESPSYPYLKELHQAIQQGLQIIGQLRLFSRRNVGTVQPSSLAALLAEEEARFRQATETAGVALSIDAPPDLPLVGLNGEALRTVLGNLLNNAREAVQGQGKVTLKARPMELTDADCLDLLGYAVPGPHVEVTITDDGSGLSPEARQRLFAEPFFTDKPRHRGLGLAVAYGILCAHKGALSVEPAGEHGTIARVFLPAVSVAAPVAPVRPYRPGLVRGEKVLVVDDDPMILKFCSATLEQAGYRVQIASNASEAFDSYVAAGTEPFRLVVSDVVMPRMTGVELARRLRNQDAAVGVLFMSGQVIPNLPKEELAGGHCDFLPKPFRPEGLLNAVRCALDRAGRRVTTHVGVPV